MRIVVMSDSHRRIGNLLDIIERHIDDTQLFIFLGDVDSDLDEALMIYPRIKIMRVQGNNDWSSPHPLSSEVVLGGKRIFFCHGHTYHVKYGYNEIINYAKNIDASICLFGHTHTRYTNYIDGLYIMNPGAVCKGEYGIIDIVDNGIMLISAEI